MGHDGQGEIKAVDQPDARDQADDAMGAGVHEPSQDPARPLASGA